MMEEEIARIKKALNELAEFFAPMLHAQFGNRLFHELKMRDASFCSRETQDWQVRRLRKSLTLKGEKPEYIERIVNIFAAPRTPASDEEIRRLVWEDILQHGKYFGRKWIVLLGIHAVDGRLDTTKLDECLLPTNMVGKRAGDVLFDSDKGICIGEESCREVLKDARARLPEGQKLPPSAIFLLKTWRSVEVI